MKRKYLKQYEVLPIGFGGWQLGNKEMWGDMSFDEGVALVHAAYESGVNFFDTAPVWIRK